MSKYKVGDELIIVNDPNKETERFKKLTHLTVDGEYAQIAWGLKIVDVQYEKPYEGKIISSEDRYHYIIDHMER